jgi:hypothetical protein
MIFKIVSLLFVISSHADSMGFECKNYYPPEQQGEEKFVKVDFKNGTAELKIAGIVGPFVSLDSFLSLEKFRYSHSESSAIAQWNNAKGEVVSLSLVFLGSFWGGNMHFTQAIDLESLSFKAGDSIDLRCVERNYPAEM